MRNSLIGSFPFHTETTTVSTGKEINVSGLLGMKVEITGTTTTSTCVFEGQVVDGGAFYPMDAVRMSDLYIANNTTSINEVWELDIIAYTKIRVNVTAISDGNITVVGSGVV